MVCGGDAVKVRQAAPIYCQSRAELGGAIRSSVNSFLDPVRDTLSVGDVEEREDAGCNQQPEDDGCADHHFLLVLLFGEALLLFGFLLFSKPLGAFFDYRLPCAVSEPQVDQGGDLLPVFGCKFGLDGFTGY